MWFPTSRKARIMIAVGALLLGGAGLGAEAAYAVSGGGYNSSQQDCPAYGSDWATPNGMTYPGCHNMAVNVESGGTTQGDPSPNNTRYVEWGNNQAPNDPNSQGTPTPYSLGEPGYTGSPHSGCLAVNTDGTGGGPGSYPEDGTPGTTGKSGGPRKSAGHPTAQEHHSAASSSQAGCGNNPNGTGFEVNYDYYQYYCPIVAAAGMKCEDQNPSANSYTFDTGSGVAYQPILANGVLVYFGMDDNTDNGEHDGLGPYSNLINPNNEEAVNGPSDGGGIMVSITPQNAGDTPSATHPEGLANASSGFCADGICMEATTQQQTVYHGCGTPTPFGTAQCDPGTPQNANVYDYAPGGNPNNDPSVNSESPNCNSGDATTTDQANCGSGGMDAIRSATPSNENAEPGVQLYSDPDPQRSPAAPSPLWPTPALYVGTCGVYAGSPATTGQALGSKPESAGGQQLTNADGQVAFDPAGC
ncbi:MAG TPA: hypothetical protein VKU88_06070 [Acidimicrobiales bacterium]|nr:hypothetical protein [Acidimicrobiales bacterium]